MNTNVVFCFLQYVNYKGYTQRSIKKGDVRLDISLGGMGYKADQA